MARFCQADITRLQRRKETTVKCHTAVQTSVLIDDTQSSRFVANYALQDHYPAWEANKVSSKWEKRGTK